MKNKGFTLLEMMGSLFVLAMISFSLGLATIQARKSSEAAVLQATATTAVTSYLEQIKSMDYPNLINAIMSPATKPLPTQSDDVTNDYLYVGQANVKNVPVDVKSDGTVIKNIKLTITPTLTDLSATAGVTAVEILMTYTWSSPSSKVAQSRALRAVRSYVPSY